MSFVFHTTSREIKGVLPVGDSCNATRGSRMPLTRGCVNLPLVGTLATFW